MYMYEFQSTCIYMYECMNMNVNKISSSYIHAYTHVCMYACISRSRYIPEEHDGVSDRGVVLYHGVRPAKIPQLKITLPWYYSLMAIVKAPLPWC